MFISTATGDTDMTQQLRYEATQVSKTATYALQPFLSYEECKTDADDHFGPNTYTIKRKLFKLYKGNWLDVR
jgi:hypothetical protein